MTVEETIKIRRSIRKFRSQEVPDILVRKLIEAAQIAPSAYNAQPSKFVIVKDEETKQKLKANNIFKQDFVYEAPLIIICCADPEVYPKERFDPVFSQATEIGGDIGAVRDLSISTQNLVLTAAGLGLGSCYIGLINRNKAKEILNISRSYVLPFAVIIGYPDEKPGPKPRKKIGELIIAEF
jgi:nitroreductase